MASLKGKKEKWPFSEKKISLVSDEEAQLRRLFTTASDRRYCKDALKMFVNRVLNQRHNLRADSQRLRTRYTLCFCGNKKPGSQCLSICNYFIDILIEISRGRCYDFGYFSQLATTSGRFNENRCRYCFHI
jgi:hypothetical protein